MKPFGTLILNSGVLSLDQMKASPFLNERALSKGAYHASRLETTKVKV